MKKFFAICIIAALTFSLFSTGCKDKKDDDKPSPTPSEQVSPSPEETPDVSNPPEETPDESPEGTPDGSEDENSAVSKLMKILVIGGEQLPGDRGLPMSFETAVTAENASGLGLNAEQFEQYVEEACVSTAAISSSAHEVALFRCKDADSAAEVKKLISENFVSTKWICVMPDQSTVIDAGEYVLLAVSSNSVVTALTDAFKSISDDAGDADTFYTSRAQ